MVLEKLDLKAVLHDMQDKSLSTLDVLPPFSLLRDFSFQNTSEHFAIRFRQSYLIWEVWDVTAMELSRRRNNDGPKLSRKFALASHILTSKRL